jgi:hypothetical protein
MSEMTSPDPKLRWTFVAAMSLALLLTAWGGYVQATHDPDPKWTELKSVPIPIVFGFWALLYPTPGMTGNLRRFMIALFFGSAAVELYLYFV